MKEGPKNNNKRCRITWEIESQFHSHSGRTAASSRGMGHGIRSECIMDMVDHIYPKKHTIGNCRWWWSVNHRSPITDHVQCHLRSHGADEDGSPVLPPTPAPPCPPTSANILIDPDLQNPNASSEILVPIHTYIHQQR